MHAGVRNRSGYELLRDEEPADQDARFDIPVEAVPYGAVALALFLTVFGVASFILAWLHFTQQLFGKEQAEVGFTIVGVLTFVPGAYHTWIAYCCWRNVSGYRWSQIPQ